MDEKRPDYPWQLPLPPGTPDAELSAKVRRKKDCEYFYEFEIDAMEFEFPSDLVYDGGADVFRFPDGRFALSREHADWPGLKAMGYLSEWGM